VEEGAYGRVRVVFQNEPVDVSEEFSRQENHFFVGDRIEEFDPGSASGKICWKSLALKQRVSYHQITTQFEDYKVWEDLPLGEYEDDRAAFRPLLRDPAHGASQVVRQAAKGSWGTDAHARGRASDR